MGILTLDLLLEAIRFRLTEVAANEGHNPLHRCIAIAGRIDNNDVLGVALKRCGDKLTIEVIGVNDQVAALADEAVGMGNNQVFGGHNCIWEPSKEKQGSNA